MAAAEFTREGSLSTSRRVLFLPSYMGSGFGHISRCLAVADEMKGRGWQAAMLVAGQHKAAVEKAGYPVFSPRFPARPQTASGESPAYTVITDGNIQALRDGFVRPWRVWAALEEAMLFIRQFKPHVLVGDVSLLTWMLGRKAGIPVVQIVRSILHPASPNLLWWEEPPPGVKTPDIRPVFNGLLERWKLDPIQRGEDLLRGDLYLVAGIPSLDPLPAGLSRTVYTGGLLQQNSNRARLPEQAVQVDPRPLVYITLGGGAGPVGSLKFFEVVNASFAGMPWRGIVSTGKKYDAAMLPKPPDNLAYYGWVPGRALIQRSQAVVYHGGYGTTMEIVEAGVPGVVLPFHTEQEANGRRLAEQRMAIVLSPAEKKDSMRLIRRRWNYGEFAFYVQPGSPLTANELRSAVKAVLEDKSYCQAALQLKLQASKYGGAAAAAGEIEQLVSI